MALALLGVAGAMSEIFVVCEYIYLISPCSCSGADIFHSRRIPEDLSITTDMDFVNDPALWGRSQFCICVHVGDGLGVNTRG